MALITSRSRLSDLASVGASARKIVNERAIQGAEAARESENILSDLQKRADLRLSEAAQTKSDLKNNTLRNGIIKSTTDLKSLKYSDFIQSKKVEPATDLRAFKNTGASIGLHKSPDTKTGLGLEVERRKDDVVRLGKAMVTGPQAVRFLGNQALLNQSVALNLAARGNFKEAGVSALIGAARVAGVTASALAQAAAEGTGLRVIQGFTPLNGGYVTTGNLLATLNPFSRGDNQISKASLALRGNTINDGFIGSSEFGSFLNQKDQERVKELRTSQTFNTGNFDAKYLSSAITKTGIGNKVGNFVTGSFSDLSVSTKFSGVSAASRNQSGQGVINLFNPNPTSKTTVEEIRDTIADTKYLPTEIFPAIKSPSIPGKFITQPVSDQSVDSDFTLQNNFPDEQKKATKNPAFSEIEDLDTLETYSTKKVEPSLNSDKGPGKFTNRTTAISQIKSARRNQIDRNLDGKSLESRFFASGNTTGQDNINVLSIQTKELKDLKLNPIPQDIIPFEIINYPATSDKQEYLYFRAYLDNLGDSYNGEWNGTKYIGRAEELYNYTGFKRSLNFGFKVAAHSAQELKPLYEKLNRLAGTTAPTYQNGLFMQGVFSKITIGDYIQKLPGFFTSVAFAWQTAYPWEIGSTQADEQVEQTPRVPHILDVTVNFQPVHDFTPQYDKTFFGFPSNTAILASNV